MAHGVETDTDIIIMNTH